MVLLILFDDYDDSFILCNIFIGLGMMLHSAGLEGFKNTKKGTNIAAQQAAITFGTVRKFFNTYLFKIFINCNYIICLYYFSVFLIMVSKQSN